MKAALGQCETSGAGETSVRIVRPSVIMPLPDEVASPAFFFLDGSRPDG